MLQAVRDGELIFLGVRMVLKVSRRMPLFSEDAGWSGEVKCHRVCSFQMIQLTQAHIVPERGSKCCSVAVCCYIQVGGKRTFVVLFFQLSCLLAKFHNKNFVRTTPP